MEKTMEKIVALAKARGFVYPGSEIYGGLANTWDYGNLGVELKNNVKKAWWQKFVQESPYNVGVDCAILMNPQTWVASGHLGGFSDPLMDCKECHERFRADKLIEDFCEENGIAIEGRVFLLTSKMYRELPARRFHLVSDRSVSPSVTRSHPAISLSVPESLNRWSWSSSASPAPIWSGSSTGEASAVTGCCLLASRKTR